MASPPVWYAGARRGSTESSQPSKSIPTTRPAATAAPASALMGRGARSAACASTR
jgi:hypothetical protein